MIRVIAKRYAGALADLSEEKKTVDATQADLASFVEAVEAHPAMQRLFASPVFTAEDKKAVIRELAAKLKLQPTTQRFIEHLAEAGRIRYARDVYEAFQALIADRQNRASVRLSTAAPLNNGDLAEIKKRLEAITGKTVDINAQVDPALIGGAKAQIGSVIYDGTIKNQLAKMREELVS